MHEWHPSGVAYEDEQFIQKYSLLRVQSLTQARTIRPILLILPSHDLIHPIPADRLGSSARNCRPLPWNLPSTELSDWGSYANGTTPVHPSRDTRPSTLFCAGIDFRRRSHSARF